MNTSHFNIDFVFKVNITELRFLPGYFPQAAMDVIKRVNCVDSNDLRVKRMFRILSLQQPNAVSAWPKSSLFHIILNKFILDGMLFVRVPLK